MIRGPPRGSLWLATKFPPPTRYYHYGCCLCVQRHWRSLIVPVQRGVNLGWGRAGGRKEGEKSEGLTQYLWNVGLGQ